MHIKTSKKVKKEKKGFSEIEMIFLITKNSKSHFLALL